MFKSWFESRPKTRLEIEEEIITLENSFSITDKSQWEDLQIRIDMLNEELERL